MICLLDVGCENDYALKISALDAQSSNLDILKWITSFVHTAQNIANRYTYDSTTYIFTSLSIHHAKQYWRGDSASLNTVIFNLLFSAGMFTQNVSGVEVKTRPHNIIDNLLKQEISQRTALELLAEVATLDEKSIW